MTDKTTSPPPAYFLSLSLENVRSFGEKQTISFARPDGRPAQWTIILGDNGVGKTTVLKALAGVRPYGNIDDLSPSLSQKVDVAGMVRRDGEKAGYLNPNCQLGFDFINNTSSDEIWEKQFVVELIHRVGYSSSSVGWSRISPELNELVCYGYGAGRTIGNSTISETPEAVDTCVSLFNDRADLLNPEEWLLFADYRIKSDKDPLTIQNFNLLKAALLKVMEEGEVTDMDVAPVLLGGGSPRQGVRFKTPYGWVRLRDMSLGYQTLVVWLTDFASKLFIRYPDSPNPLEEPAIVLIDEIDLHLHPEWQRKLIGFLSGIFKNTQFIATAHSPLVVQAAGDAGANVVLLRREGDQTVVVPDLPDVRRWRIEQILSSELFEDTSPLSPQTEADLKLRNELLLKKRPTAKDKAELERLNTLFGDQPVGTTRPERRAEDLLAQLARNLGKSDLLE